MQIQTNTDSTVENSGPLAKHVESVVSDALSRFSKQITRVVVHLSGASDSRNNGDHHCLMEARMDGHPPIAANDHATSLHQAIHGAAEKLKRSIGSTLGRINNGVKGGDVIAGSITEDNEEQ